MLLAPIGLGLFIFMASTSIAQDMVPRGQCAVVVASRPSISDAVAYIRENNWQNIARIFQSNNGWLAITAGMIANDGSTSAIARMKAMGQIPSDAYCSTGGPYVKEVDWRSNSQETSRPISRGLWAEFDARPFTQSEKRFLQASLAMEGYYSGLLDGVWGRGSQTALERYSTDEFDTPKPMNAHAAFLASTTATRWFAEGWEYQYVGYLDLSVLLPSKGLTMIEDNGQHKVWEHNSEKLTIHFNDLDTDGVRRIHDAITSASDLVAKPYSLRGSGAWVTSVLTTSGSIYMRSDLISGSWSTVIVDAAPQMDGVASLISSSIRAGRPVEVLPSETGVLVQNINEVSVAIRDANGSPPVSQPNNGVSRSSAPDTPDSREQPSSTGTGFYITEDGIALTNAHVVQDCTSVALGGLPAEIIATSSAFDLAAVRLIAPKNTVRLTFAPEDVALNSDITLAGYPLHGLLGGLNVSRGSISSMKGLLGDETKIQISAPVQPGNSGGPVVDRFGDVVGVVVSKLDTVALADATGDIAQNVNFAVRGSMAKVFLSSNGISYGETAEREPIEPEKAAELLQSATRLIECN